MSSSSSLRGQAARPVRVLPTTSPPAAVTPAASSGIPAYRHPSSSTSSPSSHSLPVSSPLVSATSPHALHGPVGPHASVLGPLSPHAAAAGPTAPHAAVAGPTTPHAVVSSPVSPHTFVPGPSAPLAQPTALPHSSSTSSASPLSPASLATGTPRVFVPTPSARPLHPPSSSSSSSLSSSLSGTSPTPTSTVDTHPTSPSSSSSLPPLPSLASLHSSLQRQRVTHTATLSAASSLPSTSHSPNAPGSTDNTPVSTNNTVANHGMTVARPAAPLPIFRGTAPSDDEAYLSEDGDQHGDKSDKQVDNRDNRDDNGFPPSPLPPSLLTMWPHMPQTHPSSSSASSSSLPLLPHPHCRVFNPLAPDLVKAVRVTARDFDHLSAVRALLAAGADPNSRESDSPATLPVHAHAECGCVAGSRAEADRLVCRYASTRVTHSATHSATLSPLPSHAEHSIAHPHYLSLCPCSSAGSTALHWACWSDLPEVVLALLAAGADARLLNREGQSALAWASMAGSVACARVLVMWDACVRGHNGVWPDDDGEQGGQDGETGVDINVSVGGGETQGGACVGAVADRTPWTMSAHLHATGRLAAALTHSTASATVSVDWSADPLLRHAETVAAALTSHGICMPVPRCRARRGQYAPRMGWHVARDGVEGGNARDGGDVRVRRDAGAAVSESVDAVAVTAASIWSHGQHADYVDNDTDNNDDEASVLPSSLPVPLLAALAAGLTAPMSRAQRRLFVQLRAACVEVPATGVDLMYLRNDTAARSTPSSALSSPPTSVAAATTNSTTPIAAASTPPHPHPHPHLLSSLALSLLGTHTAAPLLHLPCSAGLLPVHYTAKFGHAPLLNLLVSFGADVLAANPLTYATALHYACEGGHVRAGEVLVGLGARLDEEDGAGMTPLHVCVARGQRDMFLQLCRYYDGWSYVSRYCGYGLSESGKQVFSGKKENLKKNSKSKKSRSAYFSDSSDSEYGSDWELSNPDGPAYTRSAVDDERRLVCGRERAAASEYALVLMGVCVWRERVGVAGEAEANKAEVNKAKERKEEDRDGAVVGSGDGDAECSASGTAATTSTTTSTTTSIAAPVVPPSLQAIRAAIALAHTQAVLTPLPPYLDLTDLARRNTPALRAQLIARDARYASPLARLSVWLRGPQGLVCDEQPGDTLHSTSAGWRWRREQADTQPVKKISTTSTESRKSLFFPDMDIPDSSVTELPLLRPAPVSPHAHALSPVPCLALALPHTPCVALPAPTCLSSSSSSCIPSSTSASASGTFLFARLWDLLLLPPRGLLFLASSLSALLLLLPSVLLLLLSAPSRLPSLLRWAINTLSADNHGRSNASWVLGRWLLLCILFWTAHLFLALLPALDQYHHEWRTYMDVYRPAVTSLASLPQATTSSGLVATPAPVAFSAADVWASMSPEQAEGYRYYQRQYDATWGEWAQRRERRRAEAQVLREEREKMDGERKRRGEERARRKRGTVEADSSTMKTTTTETTDAAAAHGDGVRGGVRGVGDAGLSGDHRAPARENTHIPPTVITATTTATTDSHASPITAAALSASAPLLPPLPRYSPSLLATLASPSRVLLLLGCLATAAAWLLCHYSDPGYVQPAPPCPPTLAPLPAAAGAAGAVESDAEGGAYGGAGEVAEEREEKDGRPARAPRDRTPHSGDADAAAAAATGAGPAAGTSVVYSDHAEEQSRNLTLGKGFSLSGFRGWALHAQMLGKHTGFSGFRAGSASGAVVGRADRGWVCQWIGSVLAGQHGAAAGPVEAGEASHDAGVGASVWSWLAGGRSGKGAYARVCTDDEASSITHPTSSSTSTSSSPSLALRPVAASTAPIRARDSRNDGTLFVCGYAGLKNLLVTGHAVPLAALQLLAAAVDSHADASVSFTSRAGTASAKANATSRHGSAVSAGLSVCSSALLPSSRLAPVLDYPQYPATVATPASLVAPSPAAPAADTATPLLSSSHDSGAGHLHGSLLYQLAARARQQAETGGGCSGDDEDIDDVGGSDGDGASELQSIVVRSHALTRATRTRASPSFSFLPAFTSTTPSPSLVLASGAHYISPLSPLKAPPACLVALAAAFAAPVHGYSYTEVSLPRTIAAPCPAHHCRCADAASTSTSTSTHPHTSSQAVPPPWQRLASSLLPLLPFYDSPHTPTADLCLPGALAATVLVENIPDAAHGNQSPRPNSSGELVLPFSLPSPSTHPFLCAARYTHLLANGVTAPSQMCHLCRVAIPHKARHCNKCNRCVYRFDHHCPWVDNCVGAGNYRSFFAFIALGSVLAWTYVAVAVRVLIDVGLMSSPVLLLSGVYALFLAVFVSALCGSHIALVCSDMSTMEQMGNVKTNKLARPRSLLERWRAMLAGYHSERLTFPDPVLSKSVLALRRAAGYGPGTELPAFAQEALARTVRLPARGGCCDGTSGHSHAGHSHGVGKRK